MEIQWSLILFTVITGAAGWAYATLAFEEIRGKAGEKGFFIALVLLVVLAVGGLASITHLSHPENVMAALSHPTSGIFVEASLVGLSGFAALVYLIVKKRGGSAVALKIFVVLAAVFGVALSYMAGESYVVSSQPAWNTQLMPLGYCLTAAPSGIALYLLLALVKKETDSVHLLGTALCVAGLIGAVGAVAWGFASGFLADIVVCIGASVVGALVASVMGYLSRSGKNVFAFVAIALVFALAGAIAYRYGMWAVGYGINNFFGTV